MTATRRGGDAAPGSQPQEKPKPVSTQSQAEQIAALQAQVSQLTSLLSGVMGDPEGLKKAQDRIAQRDPLEPLESERDRILKFWASEPRVQIFVAPNEDDKKAAKENGGEFLPQLFQVNGVQVAVPKGKPTSVPQSIADLYAYMLDPWSAQNKAKPITFEEAELKLAK